MASELMKLYVTIDGRIEGLNRALADTQRALRQMSDKLVDFGKRANIAVTLPLVAVGTAAVKAASNLNESMNAVQVVFREASRTITDFGETAAREAGLSQRAFQELATPLGALLTNAGQSFQEAADSTILLTQRAADMASVFNTDVADALNAIQAALRGETEPIRRYGVTLNQAAIDAEAASQGFEKVNGQLTAQGRTAGALALIMKQTSAVQGDFKNTSDQLANSQRIAKAELENAAAAVGSRLLPILTQFFQVITPHITELVDRFKALSPAKQDMILKATALAAAVGPLSFALGGLTRVIGGVAGAVRVLGASLTWLAANPIGAAIAAFGALYLAIRQVLGAMEDAQAAHDRRTADIDYAQGNIEQVRRLQERYRFLAKEVRLLEGAFEDLRASGFQPTAEELRQLEAYRAEMAEIPKTIANLEFPDAAANAANALQDALDKATMSAQKIKTGVPAIKQVRTALDDLNASVKQFTESQRRLDASLSYGFITARQYVTESLALAQQQVLTLTELNRGLQSVAVAAQIDELLERIRAWGAAVKQFAQDDEEAARAQERFTVELERGEQAWAELNDSIAEFMRPGAEALAQIEKIIDALERANLSVAIDSTGDSLADFKARLDNVNKASRELLLLYHTLPDRFIAVKAAILARLEDLADLRRAMVTDIIATNQEFFLRLQAAMARIVTPFGLLLEMGEQERVIEQVKDGFDIMVEFAKAAAQGMQQAFSDFFFNIIAGKIRGLADLFRQLLLVIQRSIANVLGGAIGRYLGFSFGIDSGGAGAQNVEGMRRLISPPGAPPIQEQDIRVEVHNHSGVPVRANSSVRFDRGMKTILIDLLARDAQTRDAVRGAITP